MLDFYGRALRSGDRIVIIRGKEFIEGVVDVSTPENAWVKWPTRKSDRHAERSLLRNSQRVLIVETFDGRPCGPA